MTCAQTMPLLELELDGELDARSVLEVREHVSRCPACARQAGSLRALSDAARAHLTFYEPPPDLERRLLRPLRPRRSRLAWAAPALAATVAIAVFAAMPRSNGLMDQAATAHARSLQLDHAIDVVSTDQHTVKPWFDGKVGFAVPVRDYSAQGFTLAGGRLDYLEGRPAAAVVYRRGKHVLNLFVLDGGRDAPLRRKDVRGFSCWCWTSDGLQYVLVGDVAEPEMAALAQRMAQSQP